MKKKRDNAAGDGAFDDPVTSCVKNEKKNENGPQSGTAGFHYSLRYLLASLLVVAITVSLGVFFSPDAGTATPVAATPSLPVSITDAGHGGENCGTV